MTKGRPETPLNPPEKKEDASGQYSATDQQQVADYGHSDHRHGAAGKGSPDQAHKPWRPTSDGRGGQYGYRHDEGAKGRRVDGETHRASRGVEKP